MPFRRHGKGFGLRYLFSGGQQRAIQQTIAQGFQLHLFCQQNTTTKIDRFRQEACRFYLDSCSEQAYQLCDSLSEGKNFKCKLQAKQVDKLAIQQLRNFPTEGNIVRLWSAG